MLWRSQSKSRLARGGGETERTSPAIQNNRNDTIGPNGRQRYPSTYAAPWGNVVDFKYTCGTGEYTKYTTFIHGDRRDNLNASFEAFRCKFSLSDEDFCIAACCRQFREVEFG